MPNDSGVSPVVGVVILIAVVIALAGGGIVFFFNTSPDKSSAPGLSSVSTEYDDETGLFNVTLKQKFTGDAIIVDNGSVEKRITESGETVSVKRNSEIRIFAVQSGQKTFLGRFDAKYSPKTIRCTVNGTEYNVTYVGEGTDNNPYKVQNLRQLQCIGQNNLSSTYQLSENIFANETQSWNNGKGFEPIGSFANRFNGTIRGNGYSIYDLYINRPSTNYIGLISVSSKYSQIQSVRLVNTTIYGKNNVGGIAGRNFGLITDGYVSGNVTGERQVGLVSGMTLSNAILRTEATGNSTATVKIAGGISGSIRRNSIVSRSEFEGTVYSDGNSAGGITGGNIQSTVIRSSVDGTVIGQNLSSGGLVGYQNNARIEKSSASGKVVGVNNVGGLLGRNEGGIVLDSYSTSLVNGSDTDIGGLVGQSDSNGIIRDSYSVNRINGSEKTGGLVGWANETTIVNSYHRGNVSGSMYVGGLVGTLSGDINNSYAEGKVVGMDFVGGIVGESNGSLKNVSYSGTVKGRSIVGGLTGRNVNGIIRNSRSEGIVEGSSKRVGGISGVTDGESKIINTVSDTSVSGLKNVGGVTGVSFGNNNILRNVTSYGSTTGSSSFTGGISGSYNGVVINSSAHGIVNGRDQVGGLFGRTSIGTQVRVSHSTARVSGERVVGGLVGRNNGDVNASYATGNVTANMDAGGLIGLHRTGTINNSYAKGNVSANSNVGGLVGESRSDIRNSYSVGLVSGNSRVGGLIGFDNGGTVTDGYWDVNTSNQSSSAGGTGLTTQEMTGSDAVTNMDFNFKSEPNEPDIWEVIGPDKYPRLVNNSEK